MPDFTAHFLFGAMLKPSLPPACRRLADMYPAAFYWGLQGPDPLFFRRVLLGGSPLNHAGSRMHGEHTAQIFHAMICSILSSPPEEGRMLAAYLMGFIGHYVMDCNIHPYVFYLEGERRSKLAPKYWTALHTDIECSMDEALYPLTVRQQAENFAPDRYYSLDKGFLAAAGKMYTDLLYRVYGMRTTSKEIQKAFRDCLNLTKALYSKGTRAAAPILRVLENLALHPGVATCHVKGLPRGEGDVLNLTHQGWRNNDFPQQERRESVPDLMRQALTEAVRLAGEYGQMLEVGTCKNLPFPLSFNNGASKKAAKQG